MKKYIYLLLLSIILTNKSAWAQSDIDPPMPNVLLLVDSSGSMERMIDNSLPKCNPGVTTPLNRWATLLTVLTGTLTDYSCHELKRTSSLFNKEYSINNVDPYDDSYFLPYHRPLSKDASGNVCALGPGILPPSWLTFPVPSNAFRTHVYNDWSLPCSAGAFKPSYDGILDVFGDRARFGLMTFDTSPESYTGANGGSYAISSGMDGLWSYYGNWGNGGVFASGSPPGCPGKKMEVGARNQAAPPWEGRFVPFGPATESATSSKSRTEFIQTALLAMRPYGATPLAGMMSDAKDYFKIDVSKDLDNQPISPAYDPYVMGGCRKNYIIILSDGEPNLDLRPECAAPGGKCPFKLPEETANELAKEPDPNKQIKTFVIGFGLTVGGGTSCSQMDPVTALAPGGICTNATDVLKACCNLHRIAYFGGTEKAYFADNLGSLKSTLSSVLSNITSTSTSRTLPVFSSSSITTNNIQSAAPAIGYQFGSSFSIPGGTSLWQGNLDRKRYVCSSQNGVLQSGLNAVDPLKGDDFAANINSNDLTNPRKFFTYINNINSNIFSDRSARPYLLNNDGLGLNTGNLVGLSTGSEFAVKMSDPNNLKSLGFDILNTPSLCDQFITKSASECALRLIRWNVGETTPGFFLTREPAFCPPDTTCSELGAIYHATPTAFGAPKEYLRDESYSNFALLNNNRPLMLYTATTDGQLHAFKVSPGDNNDPMKVDSLRNNELWSFIPPIVLPRLLGSFNQQSILLDGSPVIKDVVFERGINGASNANSTWNSILVAGGGPAGGFYYALDVTDPVNPKFLWQLSTDVDGNKLFGKSTPTPTIANLAIKNTNGEIKEIAVAILAGGESPLSSGACARQPKSYNIFQPKGSYGIRNNIRCWQNNSQEGPGRSLTIVRLDTGEVLMNFRGGVNEGPPQLINKMKIVSFDSPITGIPVAYPSQPGQIASKIYVGDADGSLWRIDVSNTDPQLWSVDLIWDAYSLPGDNHTSGQAIYTAPIVSVDSFGNNIIMFSTGEQLQLNNGDQSVNRVWSLKESVINSNIKVSENWVQPLINGTRVTGNLLLFNSILYFSTYSPVVDKNNACSLGVGSIWGVDYIQSNNGLPAARYAIDPNDLSQGYVTNMPQPNGMLVFGVAINQIPTCIETQVFNDPYLGNRISVSNASNTSFQLSFQTINVGQNSDNSKTNTVVRAIPSPRQVTRVDSWASIID